MKNRLSLVAMAAILISSSVFASEKGQSIVIYDATLQGNLKNADDIYTGNSMLDTAGKGTVCDRQARADVVASAEGTTARPTRGRGGLGASAE